MGEFTSRLRQINVTSRSPKAAVEIRLAATGGMAARIGPAGVSGHTEKSFAAELEAAVAGALNGYGQATRRTFADTDRRGEADSTSKPSVPSRIDAAAAITVTGASPQNLVIITRTGAGEVSVRICPGTLRRLRDDQLVAHIDTALDVASQQLREALMRTLTTVSPTTTP